MACCNAILERCDPAGAVGDNTVLIFVNSDGSPPTYKNVDGTDWPGDPTTLEACAGGSTSTLTVNENPDGTTTVGHDPGDGSGTTDFTYSNVQLKRLCDDSDLDPATDQVVTKGQLEATNRGHYVPFVGSDGDGCLPANPTCPELAAHTVAPSGVDYVWPPGGPWVRQNETPCEIGNETISLGNPNTWFNANVVDADAGLNIDHEIATWAFATITNPDPCNSGVLDWKAHLSGLSVFTINDDTVSVLELVGRINGGPWVRWAAIDVANYSTLPEYTTGNPTVVENRRQFNFSPGVFFHQMQIIPPGGTFTAEFGFRIYYPIGTGGVRASGTIYPAVSSNWSLERCS